MSEHPKSWPTSCKRPGEVSGFEPDPEPGPSHEPMETDHEHKKIKKSDSIEDLGTNSEKSKVKFTKIYVQYKKKMNSLISVYLLI
jgi:hypothetical protein